MKTTQKVVRVRLTPNDQNMDMNDPVVQEAILQQVSLVVSFWGLLLTRFKYKKDNMMHYIIIHYYIIALHIILCSVYFCSSDKEGAEGEGDV